MSISIPKEKMYTSLCDCFFFKNFKNVFFNCVYLNELNRSNQLQTPTRCYASYREKESWTLPETRSLLKLINQQRQWKRIASFRSMNCWNDVFHSPCYNHFLWTWVTTYSWKRITLSCVDVFLRRLQNLIRELTYVLYMYVSRVYYMFVCVIENLCNGVSLFKSLHSLRRLPHTRKYSLMILTVFWNIISLWNPRIMNSLSAIEGYPQSQCSVYCFQPIKETFFGPYIPDRMVSNFPLPQTAHWLKHPVLHYRRLSFLHFWQKQTNLFVGDE